MYLLALLLLAVATPCHNQAPNELTPPLIFRTLLPGWTHIGWRIQANLLLPTAFLFFNVLSGVCRTDVVVVSWLWKLRHSVVKVSSHIVPLL